MICDYCGEEIYPYSEVLTTDEGELIHEYCQEDYTQNRLKECKKNLKFKSSGRLKKENKPKKRIFRKSVLDIFD